MFNFQGHLTVIGYTNQEQIIELISKVSTDALLFIDSKENSYNTEFCLIGDNNQIVSRMFIDEIRREAQIQHKASFIFTKLMRSTQQKATLYNFKAKELEEQASYVFGFTDAGGEILKNRYGNRRVIQMEELYFPLLFA